MRCAWELYWDSTRNVVGSEAKHHEDRCMKHRDASQDFETMSLYSSGKTPCARYVGIVGSAA